MIYHAKAGPWRIGRYVQAIRGHIHGPGLATNATYCFFKNRIGEVNVISVVPIVSLNDP